MLHLVCVSVERGGKVRFADDVVLFDFAGFSILGCTSTGAFVGLSPDEKEACFEALSSDARKIPSSVFSTEAMSVFLRVDLFLAAIGPRCL